MTHCLPPQATGKARYCSMTVTSALLQQGRGQEQEENQREAFRSAGHKCTEWGKYQRNTSPQQGGGQERLPMFALWFPRVHGGASVLTSMHTFSYAYLPAKLSSKWIKKICHKIHLKLIFKSLHSGMFYFVLTNTWGVPVPIFFLSVHISGS